MRKLIGMAVIATLFLTITSCATNKVNMHYVAKLKKEAIKLTKEKKYDEAEAKYKECIKLLPDQAQFYFALGKISDLKKDSDQAFKYYKKTNDLYPFNTEAIYSLGEAYRKKGMYDEAISKLKLSLQDRKTKNIKYLSHLSIGIALYQKGDTDLAFIHLRKAITIDPLQSKQYYYIAKILEGRGNTEAAIKEFDRTIALFYINTDKEFHKNVRKDYATLLVKNGQDKKAKQILEAED